ncbi:DNA-protecting protein DprA, partial [Candidatus Saccharibacteria bacterium]|nr:DNA-protecting protein DprA [Candidatus Saccharibacteria bacterium]
YDLAKKGVVIVSGLAYGIDACAHRGCLDAGGVTVAVLGTPIDQIYPRGNAGLAKRILERGAIISEYAPGFPTKAYCFQERNRIVSGLADFLLVIEASRQSGTKGTFNIACKQGKETFVLPGDVTRPMSAGSNEMLRAGAHPFLDASDILIRYGDGLHQALGADLSGLNELERKVYAAIEVGYDCADDIIAALNISVVDFNIAITTLECYDLITLQGDNWVIK